MPSGPTARHMRSNTHSDQSYHCHRVIKHAIVSVALLFCVADTSAADSERSQPHVVVYLVDDLGHYNVHFGGDIDPRNPDMKTPNIEKLVAEGTILRRHYTYRCVVVVVGCVVACAACTRSRPHI